MGESCRCSACQKVNTGCCMNGLCPVQVVNVFVPPACRSEIWGSRRNPLTARPHFLSTHFLFKKYGVHGDLPNPPSRQEGSAPRSAPALGCGVGCPCGSGGFPLGVRRVCAGSVRCTGSLSGARAHTLGPVTGRPRPSLSTSCEPRERRPAHDPWRISRVTPAHPGA